MRNAIRHITKIFKSIHYKHEEESFKVSPNHRKKFINQLIAIDEVKNHPATIKNLRLEIMFLFPDNCMYFFPYRNTNLINTKDQWITSSLCTVKDQMNTVALIEIRL